MPNHIHICTIDSLAAGVDLPPGDCHICGHQTVVYGWIDSSCKTCGATGACMPSIVNTVRHKAGFTRREIAKLLKVAPKTVTNYETSWCSRKYFNGFIQLIKAHYDN